MGRQNILQEFNILKNWFLLKLIYLDHFAEDLLLQEELVEMIPMVEEANAISEELDRKVKFEIVVMSPKARGLAHGRTEVNTDMLSHCLMTDLRILKLHCTSYSKQCLIGACWSPMIPFFLCYLRADLMR